MEQLLLRIQNFRGTLKNLDFFFQGPVNGVKCKLYRTTHYKSLKQ